MRGSIKTQITAALKCCTRIGMSRHEQKQVSGGKSPFIHSMGTFDRTAHRLWALKEWLPSKNIHDIELLTGELVREYLESRLAYHVQNGSSRKSYQVEVSALGNLERGLTFFSQEQRNPPMVYDFSAARKEAAKWAKILPKTTAEYANRALPEPLKMISALENEAHRLMALLQFYCGCRAEGVGAPRRRTPTKAFFTIDNFCNEFGAYIPQKIDSVTGATVQPFWTKEKGGKVAIKYCPLPLMEEVVDWLMEHPKGLGDDYENYLAAINDAMRRTGQYTKGKGTHSLRFGFAQNRYLACVLPSGTGKNKRKGMGDEAAKRRVSREMSHNRPDITGGYLY